MLLVLNIDVIIDNDDNCDYVDDDCMNGFIPSLLFLVGFTSSVLSASLGMSRLLMNGPSKLIKKQGHLGGYAQVGFALVKLSIMCVLVAKALWLPFSTMYDPGQSHPLKRHMNGDPLYALVWIGISLAPQLILVSLSKLDQKYVLKA